MSRGCGQRNLRAVQLLLGHTKLECTIRYLGIEVDDALSISKQVELNTGAAQSVEVITGKSRRSLVRM